MEDQYQHTIDGQEINETDINLVATQGALADDRVLAELLRMLPTAVGGAPAARGIIPSSYQQSVGRTTAVVQPSGSSDAKVIVNPFRAIIGAISPTTGKDGIRNSRSAICASTVGTDLGLFVQFPAATNNRWDLLYARVDVEIDGASVNRFVKTTTNPAQQFGIVTTKVTTVTLGVQPGTEATTPSLPTIPTDSGSSYYIPIAYVLLLAGHTLTTAISNTRIRECAPILSLSRATGATTARFATANTAEGGAALVNEGWTPASGRPFSYVPSTMCGLEVLHIALYENNTPRTVTLNQTAVIDASTDWRKRHFKVLAAYEIADFAWKGGGNRFPSAVSTLKSGMAQSFTVDFGGTKSVLMSLDNTITGGVMSSGSTLVLYVDQTDGAIRCTMGNIAPNCNFFFWIEATAQFNNCF